MSLNFDLRAIPEDVKTSVAEKDIPGTDIKAGDKIMNPVTRALIFSTMAVGMGEITEKNAEEFYARLSMSEALFGPSLKGDDGKSMLTMQSVIDHIGLKTNVFPKESEAKWIKRVMEAWKIDLARARRRAMVEENKC